MGFRLVYPESLKKDIEKIDKVYPRRFGRISSL